MEDTCEVFGCFDSYHSKHIHHTYYNVLPTRIKKGKDVFSSELLPLLSPSVKRGCVVSEGRHNRDSQPKPSSASNWFTASGIGLWLADTGLHPPPASEFHKIQPALGQRGGGVRLPVIADYGHQWLHLVSRYQGWSLTLCHHITPGHCPSCVRWHTERGI